MIRTVETQVLIIGAGVTGTGIMRDLALRGIKCLLIDRQDLNAGASGGNHGLLHSGGRYASSDTETAAECRHESDLLKRLAPQCIDDCGGMFVAVDGDDPEFAENFPEACAKAGIECESLSIAEAKSREPQLSDKVFAAYAIPDATVDPFRLTLENVNHSMQLNGSSFMPHMQLTGFEVAQGMIKYANVLDTRNNESIRIAAEQFVNAAGCWAMNIAQMAGCDDVSLVYSKGTLIVSNTRITSGVVNRLRPPGDGDILVPGGTVSLLGTSSLTIDDPDNIHPSIDEVDRILSEGEAMLPVLGSSRFIRAFCGVRPLIRSAGSASDGRKASRGFSLFDHEDQGLGNFVTIAGGKLTTFRLMAEKTGDLVAARLGNDKGCQTATVPLPSGGVVHWSEPGLAARNWCKKADPSDLILCECEMVPQSSVDEILLQAPGAEDHMSLKAIALRSRIGKGACQGAFCSMRVTSYLYDRGVYEDNEGMLMMRDFVNERFKGIRPVLWDRQIPQMELAETLHCGMTGLDLVNKKDEPS